MCNGDCSLKLIALSCFAVICVDFYVLLEIIVRGHELQDTVTTETFEKCFKPQLEMRMVFTSYAINSAVASLVLTVALMLFDEYSEAFAKVVSCVVHYMYLVFGPALFTLSCFGFTNIRNLSYKCTVNLDSHQINTFDIVVLFLAAILSLMVTFCYGLKMTN